MFIGSSFCLLVYSTFSSRRTKPAKILYSEIDEKSPLSPCHLAISSCLASIACIDCGCVGTVSFVVHVRRCQPASCSRERVSASRTVPSVSWAALRPRMIFRCSAVGWLVRLFAPTLRIRLHRRLHRRLHLPPPVGLISFLFSFISLSLSSLSLSLSLLPPRVARGRWCGS